MATCRECIHRSKCSKKDGTTRFYGKDICVDNAEQLCEYFISTAEVAPIEDIVRNVKESLRLEIINTPSNFTAEKGTIDFLNGLVHRQNEILGIVDSIDLRRWKNEHI